MFLLKEDNKEYTSNMLSNIIHQYQTFDKQIHFEKNEQANKLKEKDDELAALKDQMESQRQAYTESLASLKKVFDEQQETLESKVGLLKQNQVTLMECLEFNNDLGIVLHCYEEEASGKKKSLMPVSGHGMKKAEPKGVPQMLKEIQAVQNHTPALFYEVRESISLDDDESLDLTQLS
mmetsp:Transcript_21214/g.32869  ORF Transcript_21214/g.32869 Transcript_21214/m.32869 type:complete len:178 (-) Transcript_21214:270-803(-)